MLHANILAALKAFKNNPGFDGQYGINFSNPHKLRPYCSVATTLLISDSSGSEQTGATTAYFTEMARRGLQNTTNWTADTYKTILSVTGAGEVAAYVGCTAGGAQTHTVRITVDGTPSVITIAGLASGERGCLFSHLGNLSDYVTTEIIYEPGAEALDADKATWGANHATYGILRRWSSAFDVPMLQFNKSLLIEAKHSANITNSTATAYSGVMYRLYLAA